MNLACFASILCSMILLLLVVPLCLLGAFVGVVFLLSSHQAKRTLGRRLICVSTGGLLGSVVGIIAGLLFVGAFCGDTPEAQYSCLHAGVFYPFLFGVG